MFFPKLVSPKFFFLQLYHTMIFNLLVRQLIQNNLYRTHHCTHTNAAVSTKIGKKVGGKSILISNFAALASFVE